MKSGLVCDLFAGGGGVSEGIERALKEPVDVAINHWPTAIEVHKANHPSTRHYSSDVWAVKPSTATKGAPVRLLWASPDCTHHSTARGGKPRQQKLRTLPWAVVRWAHEVQPSIIIVENVPEFRTWGPLGKDGKPIKTRLGETFRAWVRKLERYGYRVEYRVLVACDYGAPTKRKRLFVIARRDGQPINWPAPTHGPGKQPFHTAAECIDWNLPCPSIFERKRPLAEKTLWRIAQGIRKFVLENPRPFVVGVGGRSGLSQPTPPEEPLGTVTAKNDRALVMPHLVKVNHGKREARAEQLEMPLSTITASQRGHALVAPVIARTAHGDVDRNGKRRGQGAHDIQDPLGTISAGGTDFAIAAPTLIQTSYGERKGQRPRYLDLHQPLGTVVAQGQKHALVSAFLAKHFGQRHAGEVQGSDMREPVGTVTAKDHHGLAAVTLAKLRGQCHGASVEEPLPTITASGFHVAEVRAFLTVYYGNDGNTGKGQSVMEPMRAITARHRLGLVVVGGTEYQIIDIGLRMLQWYELLRAQFGRYAEGYDLSAAKTQADKVRLIGNSVPPELVEAVVSANVSRPALEAA